MWPFPRADGTPSQVAPYRRIMPYLMRTRNESAVYFAQTLDLGRTLPFIDAWNAAGERRITLFHVFAWALVRVLRERPRLNRFVAGGRVWDRKGIQVSYSAKKALNDDAPVVVIKRAFTGDEDFRTMLEVMERDLRENRGDKPSHVDKELDLFLRLPGPVLRAGVALIRGLHEWGLLPRAFWEPDPMFASAFVANLGSLKMKAAYHHLYEYGSIPIFAVVGCVEKVPAVGADGQVTTRSVAEIRYTFDERVEDGLYAAQSLEKVREMVENPEAFIGVPGMGGERRLQPRSG